MKHQRQGLERKGWLAGVTACGLGILWTMPVHARPDSESAPTPVAAVAQQDLVSEERDIGEIIVSARKRQESILKVPVVMTAISRDKLENLQTTEIAELPKLATGLSVGHALLSVGSLVAIRGVGTTASEPGVDQSVSLNIDGLSLGHGLAFSSGMFDVGQIEVLKGPQALFFGKTSIGGVIALRTADPTDEVEVILRQGYEVEGDENRGELILSGPLTTTLKGRLAGMYSRADGYFTNEAVAPDPAIYGSTLGGRTPNDRESPETKNHMLRGTLLWEPSDRFNARLKANFVRDHAYGNPETSQLRTCPDGFQSFVNPMTGGLPVPYMTGENCQLDEYFAVVDMDPTAYAGTPTTGPELPNGGIPYLRNYQQYGTLELNYDLTPELTLSSVTGLYNLHSRGMVNTFHTSSAGPYIAVQNRFSRREVTEELRLTSDFSGPLNFMLGGYYQDGRVFMESMFRPNKTFWPAAFLPAVTSDNSSTMDIETNSLFGQVRYDIRPDLELAFGARWSDEVRRLATFNHVTGNPFPTADPKTHAANVAHETTLTYTPTDDLTLFAAYKRGYKSGSFAIGTVTPGRDMSFDDEKVDGYEIGLKSRLFDHQVMLNIAAYNYDFDGMQVSAIEPPTAGGAPIVRVVNAGSAETYGIELDIAYTPIQVEGLNLNASANWNHGRYENLDNVPCYGGQTIAQGCDRELNPLNGLYTAQDVSGTRMVQAPDWVANFGFDYSFPVWSDMELVIANNNQYSSKIPTFLAVGRPNDDQYQRRFIKSDLSFTLKDAGDRWEVALIGKNLGDKVTSTFCSAGNVAGGYRLGGQITGGATSGPAGYSEVGCYSERGRSVWLRLTWRPLM